MFPESVFGIVDLSISNDQLDHAQIFRKTLVFGQLPH